MELLHVEGYNEKTATIAFKRGHPHTCKLHQSLTKTPLEDIASLLARVEKYTKLEDEIPF